MVKSGPILPLPGGRHSSSDEEERLEALGQRVTLGALGALLHLELHPADLASLAGSVLDLYGSILGHLRLRGDTAQARQLCSELLRHVRDLRQALRRGPHPLRLIHSSDALAWTHATVVTGVYQLAAQHLREIEVQGPGFTSRSEYTTASRTVERLEGAAALLAGPALRPTTASTMPLKDALGLLGTVRLMRAQLLIRTLPEGDSRRVGTVTLTRTRRPQREQGAYVLSGALPLGAVRAENDQGAQMGILDAITAEEQHWPVRPTPLLRVHRILWDTVQESGASPPPAELGLPSVALVAATSGEGATDALNDLYGYAVVTYRISTLNPEHA